MIDGVFSGSNYLMARKMLDYSNLRHEALAGNLANIEVPGYKRMDVSATDFQSQLSKAVKSGSAQKINNVQPQVTMDTNAVSSREDGNNVEMDHEMMEMSRNSLEYEYLTRYINHDYQMIRSAISGQ